MEIDETDKVRSIPKSRGRRAPFAMRVLTTITPPARPIGRASVARARVGRSREEEASIDINASKFYGRSWGMYGPIPGNTPNTGEDAGAARFWVSKIPFGLWAAATGWHDQAFIKQSLKSAIVIRRSEGK